MILMILGVETDREKLWSKSCSTAYPHFSSPNAAVAISITEMPEMPQSTVDSGPTFSSLFIPGEHILHKWRYTFEKPSNTYFSGISLNLRCQVFIWQVSDVVVNFAVKDFPLAVTCPCLIAAQLYFVQPMQKSYSWKAQLIWHSN